MLSKVKKIMEDTPNLESPLASSDPKLETLLREEATRQASHIDLIASENITSAAVRQAQGSWLTNKYAEGYPGRRYYGGCGVVDQVEALAMERAQRLFGCSFSNVQPHSGSSANLAVFFALLNPGDKVLALTLSEGGHLTHGAPVNFSGKWFSPVFYALDPETHRIDMEEVRRVALAENPKMIIAGISAYTRSLDFEGFRKIADEVGAFLLVDMAHIAGLVATGLHTLPFPHAHVVTSTTHKTLRGPRGGLILWNDASLSKKLNMAIFPGLQGGPLMHVIAGKAAAFGEALGPEFKVYMKAVCQNAKALGQGLISAGIQLLTGGTDNHMLLVDLRPLGISGRQAEEALEKVGIICNKNTVPGEKRPPMEASGIRLGTPAITTRGFDEKACLKLAGLISDALRSSAQSTLEAAAYNIKQSVQELANHFLPPQ